MTTAETRKTGNSGEASAAAFLEKLGHSIIARNYRFHHAELDIVSTIDDLLVISEVKSFRGSSLGAPEYRVNRAKQRQIIQGAYGFLAAHPRFEGYGVRFDVIIVALGAGEAEITHYEGAFYEQGY